MMLSLFSIIRYLSIKNHHFTASQIKRTIRQRLKCLQNIRRNRNKPTRSANIKKYFLIFAFVIVSVIALLYGISPQWFAITFLGVVDLDLNLTHILRAVMSLYIALGLFWLFSAFSNKYRNTAILTTVIFSAGLVIGRFISFLADGQPSPILVLYIFLEFILIPIAYWVFRLPE